MATFKCSLALLLSSPLKYGKSTHINLSGCSTVTGLFFMMMGIWFKKPSTKTLHCTLPMNSKLVIQITFLYPLSQTLPLYFVRALELNIAPAWLVVMFSSKSSGAWCQTFTGLVFPTQGLLAWRSLKFHLKFRAEVSFSLYLSYSTNLSTVSLS